MARRAGAHHRPALVAALALVVLAAACDSSAVTPLPSARPSGFPGAVSSRAPSPPSSPDPATAAINAFVELVTADRFSYQATFTGQSRHTTTILPISNGILQMSGDNVLVRGTFKFEDGFRYTVEHRFVGGKGWIRYDTSLGWERVPVKPTDTMAAFASVKTATDVKYLEKVTSGGKTLFRVEIRSAIVNPVMIPASNLTETSLTTPKLTLLIDTAGRPVRGTAEIEGRGRVSRQLQEIVIDLTVTFTKVGQAVTIKAP